MKTHYYRSTKLAAYPIPCGVGHFTRRRKYRVSTNMENVTCKRCLMWIRKPRVDDALTEVSAMYIPKDFIPFALFPNKK